MPPEDFNKSKAYDYLSNKRCIDESILKPLFNRGDIRQFTINGKIYVGFIGKENNQIKYLSLRSIEPTYNNLYDKYDYKNSDKQYAFKVNYINDINDKINIYIFEAPIDLLSFINLQLLSDKSLNNKLFLCAGGLNNKSINKAIEQYGDNIEKINICFDNDEAGNNYTEVLTKELIGKNIITSRIMPLNKDFNEDLVNYKLKISVMCEST